MNRLTVAVIAGLTLLAASAVYPNGGESSQEEQNHAHVAPEAGHDHAAQKAGHDHGHKSSAMQAISESCLTTKDQDCKAIAAIADQLYQAIRSGDSDTVRTLLAPDVLIFESGHAETSLEEYAGHHMPADMAFLATMDMTLLSRQVTAGRDMAVISSRSRLSGFYQDTEQDIISTETLVLQRTNGDWQVVHVHWSSSP